MLRSICLACSFLFLLTACLTASPYLIDENYKPEVGREGVVFLKLTKQYAEKAYLSIRKKGLDKPLVSLNSNWSSSIPYEGEVYYFDDKKSGVLHALSLSPGIYQIDSFGGVGGYGVLKSVKEIPPIYFEVKTDHVTYLGSFNLKGRGLNKNRNIILFEMNVIDDGQVDYEIFIKQYPQLKGLKVLNSVPNIKSKLNPLINISN